MVTHSGSAFALRFNEARAVNWGRQLSRFGMVGVAANALGLGVFAVLTWSGLPPTAAVFVVYPLGALVGYCGNKQLTFEHRGEWRATGERYVLMQLGGLLINLGMLWLMGDVWGMHPVAVQALAVAVVAAYGFLAMRYYVFARKR